METKYLISEDEYVRAGQLFMKPSRKKRIYSALGIAVLVGLAAFGKIKITLLAAILAFVLVGNVIARQLVAPWETRRQYRAYRAISESAWLLLEEAGLRFRNADSDFLVRWEHILKWRENEEFILLYQNARLYHIIPNRLAADGLDIPGIIAKLAATIGRST